MIEAGIDNAAVLIAAVEHDPDALVIVDRKNAASLADAPIIYANAAVEKLTGFEIGSLVGRPLSVIAPEDAAASATTWLARTAFPSPLRLDVAVRDVHAGDRTSPYAVIRMRESTPSQDEPSGSCDGADYRDVFEINPCAMWVYDIETSRFLAVNQAAIHRYGYSRDEFLRMRVNDLRPDGSPDRLLDWLRKYPAAPLHGGVAKHRTKLGRAVDSEIHSAPIDWDGRPARVVTLIDVTERQQLVSQLQRSEDVLESAQQTAQLGSFEFDARTQTLTCSKELYDIYGLAPVPKLTSMDELARHMHPEDADFVRRTVADALQSGSRYVVDHRILRADGMVRWVSQRGQCSLDSRGKPSRIIGTLLDITERKESEDRLAFLAHHDSLTGLPNRNLLVDRLSQILTHAHRNKRLAALLFLDLDNFKHVNDTLGHVSGDRLLQAVGKRLRFSVRAGDIVARPGGDEFIIVLADVARVDVAAKLAQKIIHAFSAPFETDDEELFITTSIGVSIFPHDGEDAEQLIRRADTAMYQAKENGRDKFQFFAPTMQDAAVTRLSLENDLRRAVGRGELRLHYQPVVDASSGEILASEALLRWEHPARGTLYPADFLSIADETGLVNTIGEWVLHTACAHAKSWRSNGRRVSLAVNLSPRQFLQPKLIGTVTEALREANLPASALEFELTENALAKEPETSRRMLAALRELGVRFSIDSFGTGYTSLEQLRDLPVDAFKIGRGVVRNIDADEGNAAIAAGIIALARGLGRRVVAVGVETSGEADALRRLGCDVMQGYRLGRPVPPEEFARLLK